MEISTTRAADWVANQLDLTEANKALVHQNADKVDRFVGEHKSIVFFGLSTLFTFITAPWRLPMAYTLRVIAWGVSEGLTVLALSNFFGSKGISEEASDKINYLLGAATLLERVMFPYFSDVTALTNLGWVASKEAYRAIWPIQVEQQA